MWFRRLATFGAVAVVTACSQAPAPTAPDATPGDRFPLRVEVVTTSWRLAPDDEDGGTCTWYEPAYALRDGAGAVLDVGDLADDEGTAVGEVRGSGTDASCVLVRTIDAPMADVYDLEITATAPADGVGRTHPGAGDQFTASAMISRTTAADEVLTVTLDGPAPIY